MATKGKGNTFAGIPSVTRGQGGVVQPIPRRATVVQPSRAGHSSVPADNVLPSPQVQRSGPVKQPLPSRPADHMQRGTPD
jgi:hypothetical protein